jgi:hypothetical protein
MQPKARRGLKSEGSRLRQSRPAHWADSCVVPAAWRSQADPIWIVRDRISAIRAATAAARSADRLSIPDASTLPSRTTAQQSSILAMR